MPKRGENNNQLVNFRLGTSRVGETLSVTMRKANTMWKSSRRSRPLTPLCSINCKPSCRSKFITNDFTRKFLREVCEDGGGKSAFGFDPAEISNKSI